MKYMGSKNRIADHLLSVMIPKASGAGICTWVEPFVGGGNMIDKVPSHFTRIGFDVNPHTIAALTCVRDYRHLLPDEVSVDYYKSLKGSEPDPVTSLIRFGASFGGKFENGFARRNGRSMWAECLANADRQSPRLQGVRLGVSSYDQIEILDNCLVYCDPPYKGTTPYKTGSFDHGKFWDWCRQVSRSNLIFISEYEAPHDFKCVWEGSVKTNFSSNRVGFTKLATEKLFTL